jgi:hypothetical protein
VSEQEQGRIERLTKQRNDLIRLIEKIVAELEVLPSDDQADRVQRIRVAVSHITRTVRS